MKLTRTCLLTLALGLTVGCGSSDDGEDGMRPDANVGGTDAGGGAGGGNSNSSGDDNGAGSGSDAAAPGASAGGPSLRCSDIEMLYGDLAATSDCVRDSDCHVLSGSCGVGLGGCYAVVNRSVAQDQLDALGAQYSSGGCTSAVCRCAPPPEAVRCSTEGRCVAADG